MEFRTPKMVVVIDHDAANAEELKDFLQSEGYQVKVATDPVVKIEGIADANQTLAVLFDHQGDALETSKILRSLRAQFGKDTMMVFMHEFSVEAVKSAVAAGFNEYLAKPVGHEALLSLLSKRKKADNPKKISMTIKIEATIFDE